MVKKLCLATAACVLGFLILEGLCSSVIVAYQLLAPQEHRTLSGRAIQFDPVLGWVSIPNFYAKDYYAPGIYLRTNSRGFRANQEFQQQVPPGKVRIICSGDSFTFGDGLSNDASWCQQLQSIDDRIEPVNMAETGYGVDQMYLRYKRDSVAFEHDIHIFAFIADDFRRMQLSTLAGYGKPMLTVQDGKLVAGNIPVPRRSHFLHWLALKPHPLRQFRSLAALAWLVEQAHPAGDAMFSKGPTEQQGQILDKLFQDLQTIEQQKHSVLVLLYLPSRISDYETDGSSSIWREWIRMECSRRGIAFVDFVDDFQKLPVTMKDGLFIWPGSTQYFAEAPGHYNDEGQRWIAKELFSKLASIPQVAEKLGKGSEPQVAREDASHRGPSR